MATALRLAFIFWMVRAFLHFMTAGANIFTIPILLEMERCSASSPLYWGMLCVLVMGLYYGLWVPAAVCGAVLALGSLILSPVALFGRCRANTGVRRIRRTPRHEVAAGPQAKQESGALRCERPGQTKESCIWRRM
jgi:hypothetical protein